MKKKKPNKKQNENNNNNLGFFKKKSCWFEKYVFVVQAMWKLQKFLAIFLSFELGSWA